MKDFSGIITIDPAIRGGKPTIRGMRITVFDILEMLADGMSVNEIVMDFPELTPNDIYSALSYAAQKEHRTKICA